MTSDSAPLGLDPTFRTEVLPALQDRMVPDIHGVKPVNRIGVRGLVEYVWHDTDHVELTRDHGIVAVPVKSYHAEPRVYPDGLRVVDHPVFSGWLRRVVSFIPPELRQERGSVHINYFETGGYGSAEDLVVEGPHQDDEEWVVSFVETASDEGAVTTLSKPEASATDEDERLIKVAAFRLAAGDLALSDDVNLWHDVSKAKGRRRALILVFNKPETYDWLQEYYARLN